MPRSDRKDIGRIQKPDQTRSNGGIAKIRDFAHHHVNLFLTWGEVEGIVCSGIDKGKKTTYALLDERVPPTRELCREEALARLASRYFQSHSPAQLQDFVWWSGLTATECRLAINLIKAELMTETFDSREYFIHQSWKGKNESEPVLRLLPAFDEYLISYKNRTDVLPLEHHPKAFNRFGTFYPVILYNGKIIGNWSRSIKKNTIQIEMDFFEKKPRIPVKLIQQAEAQIDAFYRGLLYRPALQCREK